MISKSMDDKHDKHNNGGVLAFDNSRAANNSLLMNRAVLATAGSPYLKRIRETALSAFVEEQALRAPAAMLNAFEELALIRETATRSVEIYARAREEELKDPENATKSMLAAKAAILMNESLREVVEVIERASRIASNVSRTFSWGYINNIVVIMMRAISDTIGDNPVMLEAIHNRLMEDFDQLREHSTDAQQLEDTALAMDDSVPMGP